MFYRKSRTASYKLHSRNACLGYNARTRTLRRTFHFLPVRRVHTIVADNPHTVYIGEITLQHKWVYAITRGTLRRIITGRGKTNVALTMGLAAFTWWHIAPARKCGHKNLLAASEMRHSQSLSDFNKMR